MRLKNLMTVQCGSCDEKVSFFKYAKSQICCPKCTVLLAKPTGHKAKLISGKIVLP